MSRAGRWAALALLLGGGPVCVQEAWAQGPAMPPASPAPPPVASAQHRSDSRTQTALRHVLGELMQQHGDLTGKVPDALNEADIAMRDAARALEAGDDATAAAAIQKAIEALQKGGRSMSQQLAQQFGQGGPGDEGEDADGEMAGEQDGEGQGEQDGKGRGGRYGNWNRDGRWGNRPGDRREADRRDPLGRPLREDGLGQSPDEGGVKVPDQMEEARSHAIQEELRRRGAEKTRPQPELDYIDRLLRQF
ncbi:conserved protein of unknown function [Rhodovastum atsumiense]|uniref:DUF4175 domain-containing protein n=1 Tax=Rhodovastum atsumiense TaxID=504468 RepID=A0A5M6IY69_9PROT|nr:DUF4175 family protein [Rhodovastum atsumiense]KAA5613274.1 DUF4175 domain-containing protein [Rhodovastum atsumiense]CAH2600562.1 conserved protein of unknown function [Rhodovastum atsumiense]